MKKHFAMTIMVAILTIIFSSFRPFSNEEKDVMENVAALLKLKKIGQTCTMGCMSTEFFYICVECGSVPSDECTILAFNQGIGDRSTCGADPED